MPLNLLIRCDSPGCEQFRLTPTGQPPTDWLTINGQATFDSWTCLAIYAAQVAGQLEKAVKEPSENGTTAEPEPAEVVATGTPE